MNPSGYHRRFIGTIIVVALALPWLLWGARQASNSIYNSPPDWVPQGFPQSKLYSQFRKQFEGNDMIAIGWEDCTIDDERLDTLQAALLTADKSRRESGQPELFSRILSGRSVLHTLTGPPSELSERAARSRLRGSLLGDDGRSTYLLVLPTMHAAYHREEALDELTFHAGKILQLDSSELYMVGPPVDGYRIDLESAQALQKYSIPSTLVSLLLCWIIVKSWRLTLAVIGTASLGSLLALSLVYYSGAQMNAILIVLSPLVLVVTVSGGVHLVNYFSEALHRVGPEMAVRKALASGTGPCLLAAMTTAIGLGSLGVSRIGPISLFAVVAAVSVLVAVGLLLLILPSVMQHQATRHHGLRLTQCLPGEPAPRWAGWLTKIVGWCPSLIVVASLLLMLACGWGLRALSVSVNVHGLFAKDSRIVRDYEWFESRIGPMVPVETVLRFDSQSSLDELQQLELVRAVSLAIKSVPELDGILSAQSYLPTIPRRFFQRTIYRTLLKNQLLSLGSSGYLVQDEDSQTWRISARASALRNIDYGHLLKDLEEVVEPVLARLPQDSGVTATYTGVMSLVDEAQRALLRDLVVSFLTAFVVIGVVMVLVTRNVVIGMMAMLPNLFPVTIVFGVMGWLGISVDIGTVMTASVALGFCVDGTVHYLEWYRKGLQSGEEPQQAIEIAFRRCGVALVQAAAICGAGLMVFSLSEFLPVRKFAWIMLIILLLGLIADLLLLPALLLSGWGQRVLRVRPRQTSMGTRAVQSIGVSEC